MEQKSLVKGKISVIFFKFNSPYYSLSQNNSLIIDDNEIALELNFPSFKSNLDFNQDGKEILNNFAKYDEFEINETAFFEIFVNLIVQNSEKFDKNNFKVIFNFPTEQKIVFCILTKSENKFVFTKKT